MSTNANPKAVPIYTGALKRKNLMYLLKMPWGPGVFLRTGGPVFYSKDHRVHAVYVLAKSVDPKAPWSVVSCLPRMLSQEKNFLSISETSKNCGDVDGWCYFLSSSGRNRTLAIVKWACLLRSNVLLCLKHYMGLGLPSGTRQQQSSVQICFFNFKQLFIAY